MNPADDPLAAPPATTKPNGSGQPSLFSRRIGVVLTLVGLSIFTLGVKPGWFQLDRSPGVGFAQIGVLLFGLGIMCVGGLMGLRSLWQKRQRSIASDIGLRLVATGYVIVFFAAMADVLGLGSQTVQQPFFGPVQAAGVVFGEVVIAIGFLMLIPFPTGTMEK